MRGISRPVSIALLAFFTLGFLVYMRIQTLPPIFAQQGTTRKISISASFYPLFFFASRVAKDRAQVTTITPAGSEPHDYELTPQDMVRIAKSDLLILNGAGLEPWSDSIRDALHDSPVSILTVGHGLADKRTISENEIERLDPHIWLSPRLAQQEVMAIADELKRIDPAGAPLYEKNTLILQEDLAALDARYRERLGSCEKNDIITSHASFGYVAAEYGFNQMAIVGLSPDAEPTPKKLAALADAAKENGIRIIFFETLVSPRVAEILSREVGAKTRILNPLEGLTIEEIIQGKNYLTEMDANLSALTEALQCR